MNKPTAKCATQGQGVGMQLQDVSEEAATDDEGKRPQQYTAGVVEQEQPEVHPGLPGDGACHGVESGQKLADQQGAGAVLAEVALGALDAGIALGA